MRRSNLQEEKKILKKGFKYAAGLDEAGRGPLAGPVVAAAVVIKISNDKFLIQKQFQKFKIKNLQLRDSKKLSHRQRECFYGVITKSPFIKWGIGKVSEKAIDKINILEATKLAMKKAIENLKAKKEKRGIKIDFLIIDGNFKIDSNIPQKSIVKADEKVLSCAAASIIAKVTRDRMMEKLHKKYPWYGFDKNKGYPTKFHLAKLKKYGPCRIHRKSFKPLEKLYFMFRKPLFQSKNVDKVSC